MVCFSAQYYANMYMRQLNDIKKSYENAYSLSVEEVKKSIMLSIQLYSCNKLKTCNI